MWLCISDVKGCCSYFKSWEIPVASLSFYGKYEVDIPLNAE